MSEVRSSQFLAAAVLCAGRYMDSESSPSTCLPRYVEAAGPTEKQNGLADLICDRASRLSRRQMGPSMRSMAVPCPATCRRVLTTHRRRLLLLRRPPPLPQHRVGGPCLQAEEGCYSVKRFPRRCRPPFGRHNLWREAEGKKARPHSGEGEEPSYHFADPKAGRPVSCHVSPSRRRACASGKTQERGVVVFPVTLPPATEVPNRAAMFGLLALTAVGDR